MSANNGGPAFPIASDRGERLSSAEGMSLRDYFAGIALQALISNEGDVVHAHHPQGVLQLPKTKGAPIIAYQYADAMLKERAK